MASEDRIDVRKGSISPLAKTSVAGEEGHHRTSGRQQAQRWPVFRLTMSITVFLLMPTLRAMSRYDTPSACIAEHPLGLLV
jgi:hypothetical protein